jgi:Caspase domain
MKVRPTLPLLVLVAGLLASALSPRPAPAQQITPDAGRTASPPGALYYALVIGNDDYASLPQLTTAARDARAVERVLRETYGFQTRLLVNATRSGIVTALSDYRRRLNADASLLVYYAGHGRTDAESGKAYWLPVDATREDASGWIPADEITKGIRVIPARHVLVVSDSCYSGALPHGLTASPARTSERALFLRKMAAGRSLKLMVSGGDEPVADDGGRHSVFAAALLRGLRKMEGPRFTASELFVGHVLAPVAGRAGLLPVYNALRDDGHESGDFVFTRIKPVAAPGSCDDPEEKGQIYETFLANYKGSPDQQKTAYEAGRDYVARYDRCPEDNDKNVIGYVRKWMAKYEAAVRDWERWRSRQP